LAHSKLSRQQRKAYGQYNGAPTPDQLTQFFFLDDQDLTDIRTRRTETNRLGYALQLCSLRFLGTAFGSVSQVPLNVVKFVARQLSIRNPRCRHDYSEHSYKAHLVQLQARYGYQDFHATLPHFRYLRWLYARAWSGDESFGVLFDLSTQYLVTHKILLPGVTVLERLVNRVRRRAAQRLIERVYRQLSVSNKQNLDRLLEPYATEHSSELNDLRTPVPNVNSVAINALLDKLDRLRAVGVGQVDLGGLPRIPMQAITQRLMRTHVGNIRRLRNDQRHAQLAIFVRLHETRLIDEVLYLVEAFIGELQRKVKQESKKERLKTLKELDEAARQLSLACSVLLDETIELQNVRSKAFQQVSRSRLQDAIAKVNAITRPQDDQQQKEWLDQFHRIKRFLPRLVASVTLASTVAGQPVLEALQALLPHLTGDAKEDFDPPLTHVPKSWRTHILQPEGVDLQAYTVCTTKLFRDALIRRDVFVIDSQYWNDPRRRLLRGKAWLAVKPTLCRALNLSEQPGPKLDELKRHLHASYEALEQGWDQNDSVRVETQDGKPKLVISPLEALDEPGSLVQLRQFTRRLMPLIDLPELMLEVHARTGFADAFTHISENSSRASDLHISICAVLMAQACNIGLEPLIQSGHPALSRSRLRWVQQNYIRPETLVEANKAILWLHSSIPLVKHWGSGQVASADGLRFTVPVHTAHSRFNKLYFHSSPGVTYYNFLSDQFGGFHGLLVPGTMRDSLFLLQAVLEQQSHLDPREIMTDTAGASDVIFGLFWLLGYQFSPRIADMGSMRFWRADPDADYGPMNAFSRHHLKLDQPEKCWEDCLRTAGSLKMGTIGATELIRSLLHQKRPSSLGKAIAELGKAVKTIHALRTLTDKNYRRRILTQLNRGESRHALARTICYGNSGELRQPYREGQEDQLGALGLVTNIVVLWNTLYLEATINYLRDNGIPVRDEDIARLSPVIHDHLHVMGRYRFTVDPKVEAGQMRPILERDEMDELF
jgi:TnpA family transposase